MSAVIGSIAGSMAAITAAAQQREEEDMATYNKSDLDGWEFKIVRSVMGGFNSSAKMEQVCREEAQNGWELVEKFDDHRLRFKRRTDRPSPGINSGLPNDGRSKIDPYRSSVGVGGGKRGTIFLGLALVLLGLVAFYMMSMR